MTLEQAIAKAEAEENAAQERIDNAEFEGFKVGDLKAIFAKMHDPADWKAPIAVWMSGESVSPACSAIRFMTATEPQVSYSAERHAITTRAFLVQSEGYRNGPAGDH